MSVRRLCKFIDRVEDKRQIYRVVYEIRIRKIKIR
jgi:hypothetical protein